MRPLTFVRLIKGLFFLPLVFLLVLSVFLFWEHLNRSGFWRQTTKVLPAIIKSEPGVGLNIVLPTIVPVSADFGLIIEKIGVNAPIFDVDGFNEKEYGPSILQGIGHFRQKLFLLTFVNGNYPDGSGNIFLFGHSQIPGGDENHYKGVFNNLGQLETGNNVIVYYQGKPFYYQVYESKIVDKTALEYLVRTPEETLTLMTCWPLGLDVKRYIVRARRIS